MSGIVYLNGHFLERAEAKLSVDDRGFFFGDGVYEVTRAVQGRLFEWDRHARRLERGLRELRLSAGLGMDELHDVHLRLLQENGLLDGQATVYLQITRGAAPRTHHFPPAGTPPTVFVSATGFMPPNEQRGRGVAAVTYPDYRWSRCDLKTVNLLASVMAKQHAADHGAFESIFVRNAVITEGSHTNVFGVLDGELRTYPNSNYVLPGVTRDVVVEIARELEIPVSETPIYVHEVPRLQELFLTGTTSDVMPIATLDGRAVGSGAPGPIATRLHQALAARLAATTGPRAGATAGAGAR
ncbi:MAG TPA: aminotransferase class IV [Gemmatimonadaceae bacterium]|nr:aminotransferase class IV [Gemmatimonadaceae bacterium]